MSNNRQELLNNGTAVGPQGEGRESPSTFPKYPAYKDSGVEWLGKVPEHWEVGSLRRLIKSVGNGTTADQVDETDDTVAVSRIETISTGQINFEKVGRVGPKDLARRFLLNAGDILFSHINSLSMIGNVALYPGGRPLLHGMNLLRIQPLPSISSEWLLYWLKSKNVRQEVESRAKPAINQASISTDSVRALPALIPPSFEQTQIARFLDHETARIDALIEEQQRLIELLKEKRQAVISHAVTKGLDPTVPMKDSGVEWLGEVPAHWDVLPVWMLFQMGRGRVISHDEIAENSGDYPVYSSQTERDGVMGSIDTYDFEGDYLTWTTDGANAGTVFRRSGKFNCTNVCGTLLPKRKDDDLRYFVDAVGICTAAFIRHDINPKLMNNVMASIKVPVPPLMEQTAIAAYVSAFKDKETVLIQEAFTGISLLQERRSALISAAVTGKIDVRNW